MEISIEHLNKNYGKQNVLKDISLHIPIGMYGMLGENGAGKTTLMRILATLSEPTTGMVEINGIDIKRKKEIRKIIGYLPQEFSIYPNMTVYSALDYLGILAELPNNIRKRRINELLKWSYRKSVSIRLICSFWMITVMITIFASIMRLQNCSFPFLKYVTVTILYAVFLGILGLLFSQLGNNVIIGYLASLGYWSFCQFDILTEENVLYIFPIISGEIEMGKLMILMSINSFLLVVFFLSVKETRGMYK